MVALALYFGRFTVVSVKVGQLLKIREPPRQTGRVGRYAPHVLQSRQGCLQE